MDDCDVEGLFWKSCDDVGLKCEDQDRLRKILAPFRSKSQTTHEHYLHSLRVGIRACRIGNFIHHEEKPLLLAGALHDIGKSNTPIEILGRTGSWSEQDQEVIELHVMDGYKHLQGHFDYTAEIVLWHHRFQEHSYPGVLPPFMRDYDQPTQLLIREYGRILAIADVYDALHRLDEKHGAEKLTSQEVKKKMFEYNPDRTKLISALYESKILT